MNALGVAQTLDGVEGIFATWNQTESKYFQPYVWTFDLHEE